MICARRLLKPTEKFGIRKLNGDKSVNFHPDFVSSDPSYFLSVGRLQFLDNIKLAVHNWLGKKLCN